ncbi:MAG: hypothetical protein J3K34DRAFT_390620 [Monoraphidium minutum]|nr:MAG: hypothetical protein J3K34DRAFT_390620 [Monoraphidium minutum]
MAARPVSRLRLALLMFAGFTIWTQISLRLAARPNFQGSASFEDTPDARGTRYRIHRRAAATQNTFITVEALIRPGAPGWYPTHAGSLPLASRGQSTSIVVRKGVMAWALGEGEARKTGRASAGETVVVPEGEAHSYHNPSKDEPLQIEIIIAPVPPMAERFFESLAGLTRTYKDVRDIPPLQMVLLLSDAGIQMRGVSKIFAFASEKVLPHVARVMGYKSTYPQYASPPTPGTPGARLREGAFFPFQFFQNLSFLIFGGPRSTYPQYASGAATAKDSQDREPEWEARSPHHQEL